MKESEEKANEELKSLSSKLIFLKNENNRKDILIQSKNLNIEKMEDLKN